MSDFGVEPIHITAIGGKVMILDILLDHERTKNSGSAERILHVQVRDQDEYPRKCLGQELYVVGLLSSATPLHLATWAGKDDAASKLLEYGADVNISDANGWTPLHHAAQKGNSKTVKLLLDEGADTNACTNEGATPLLLAVASGCADVVDELVLQSCDIMATDVVGRGVAHWAVNQYKAAALQKLYELNVPLDARDIFGRIQLGALWYRPGFLEVDGDEIFPFLVEKTPLGGGENPKYGNLLNEACSFGLSSTKVVNKILSRLSSECTKETSTAYVNNSSELFGTPLYFATYRGEVETMSLLLDAGADLALARGPLGSALNAACVMGRTEAVRFILKRTGEPLGDEIMQLASQHNSLTTLLRCYMKDGVSALDEVPRPKKTRRPKLSTILDSGSAMERVTGREDGEVDVLKSPLNRADDDGDSISAPCSAARNAPPALHLNQVDKNSPPPSAVLETRRHSTSSALTTNGIEADNPGSRSTTPVHQVDTSDTLPASLPTTVFRKHTSQASLISVPGRNRLEHLTATWKESEDDLNPFTSASNQPNTPTLEENTEESSHTSSLSTPLRRHAARASIIALPNGVELQVSRPRVLITTPTSHPTYTVDQYDRVIESPQTPTASRKKTAETGIVNVPVSNQKKSASGSDGETALINASSSQSSTPDVQVEADTTSPPRTPGTIERHVGRSSTIAISDGIDAGKSIAPASESISEMGLLRTLKNRPITPNLQTDVESSSPPQTPTIIRKKAEKSSTVATPSDIDVKTPSAVEGESVSNTVLISIPSSRPTTPVLQTNTEDTTPETTTIITKHEVSTSTIEIDEGIDSIQAATV